jgi:RNA polymerase sigma-70 factor (ECF subfamily)
MNPFRPRRVSRVEEAPPNASRPLTAATGAAGGSVVDSSGEQGMFAENVLVARERVVPGPATAVPNERAFDSDFAGRLEGELQMAYRLAGYLMADSADAQDAVQEASVRAWRGWSGLREKDSFHAWFSQILVNVCRTKLRQRSRRRTVDVEDVDLEAADPFKASLARDTVGRALSALSDELRMVVVLRYWGDMPLADIAARLNIPIGTVKSRHHAALQALRRRVERLEGGAK